MKRRFFPGTARTWALAALLAAGTVSAADWPQLLGPTRDGVSPESVAPWPSSGPKLLWKAAVGSGYSGPVVAGGRLLLHHREGDEEVLQAYDAVTGKPAWRAAQPTAYRDDFGFDDGPRATPAVSGGMAFVFGAAGRLTAVRLSDGTTAWSRPAGEELHADKGFFGFASSPLVWSNRVVVQLGGRPGAGIVAFDVADGRTAWKATDDEAGYASPVLAEIGGRTRMVAFNRAGVTVLEPADGRVLARQAWRSRQGASVNAATPLVLPQGVFVTASYNTGAALFRPAADGSLEKVWSDDESLSAHFATPVAQGGLLFGFHGRQEQGPSLRCVEVATGRVRWSEDGFGSGSVIRAGDRLLVLREDGELLLGAAKAERWDVQARAQVLGGGIRALPALAHGIWYGRDKRTLVAFQVSTER